MTSLALVAHCTHTAAPAFNGLFYATTATILPVLFLAITLQGRQYEANVKALTARQRRTRWPFSSVGRTASKSSAS
jgi:hypothetical protein